MAENRLIWFKGEIIPVIDAKINVLAPTSQFGANVFEGIRCYWNNEEQQLYAFRLDEHLVRLINSCELIGFESKYRLEELVQAFIDVVKANNYKEDISVRQTIFLDGFGSWGSTKHVNMFIAPIPKGRPYPMKKGLTCCVSSWERIHEKSLSPKIKCGANYINSRMAQLEAIKNNFDTAILLNRDGYVAEGPGSCIFIVKNDILITPPLEASILDSITRKTIIESSIELSKLEVIEQNIEKEELYHSDEIFLCGSSMEITPVLKVDKYEINTKQEGEITKKIKDLYFQIVRNKIDKFEKWLTPIYQISPK
jgi:branched-chain amino acid aminotransferase